MRLPNNLPPLDSVVVSGADLENILFPLSSTLPTLHVLKYSNYMGEKLIIFLIFIIKYLQWQPNIKLV